MAKCVKLKSGKIVRVSDFRASQMVNNGEGTYVPKRMYKLQESTSSLA